MNLTRTALLLEVVKPPSTSPARDVLKRSSKGLDHLLKPTPGLYSYDPKTNKVTRVTPLDKKSETLMTLKHKNNG